MQLPYLTPLTPEQIAGAGVPGRWTYGMADRVRFAELDALNHVNNVAYLQWLEVLRVRYFVDWGMTRYRADDPQLVVRSQTAEYLAPLLRDADYIVTCRTTEYRRTSFTLDYVVFSDGAVKLTASTVIVMVEPDGATKRALPDTVIERFRDVDGATRA